MWLWIFGANILIKQWSSASYWALHNWTSLLPKGKHANFGVLQALDALADLALRNNFSDFQHESNKLVIPRVNFVRNKMFDLYPVIIHWLSKEVCVAKFWSLFHPIWLKGGDRDWINSILFFGINISRFMTRPYYIFLSRLNLSTQSMPFIFSSSKTSLLSNMHVPSLASTPISTFLTAFSRIPAGLADIILHHKIVPT